MKIPSRPGPERIKLSSSLYTAFYGIHSQYLGYCSGCITLRLGEIKEDPLKFLTAPEDSGSDPLDFKGAENIFFLRGAP